MKTRYTTIAAAAFLMMAASASAQTLNSGYFTEGYKFRHELNPAFAPTRSYLALPVVSGTSLDVSSNAGVSNFIYPGNNGPVTFMHSTVTADQFLGSLPDMTKIGVNGDFNLLSIGGWGRNSFTTFSISLNSSTNIGLPKDLFSMLKSVGGQETYRFSGLGLNNREYIEISLGQSRKLSERLNIGYKFKFLVGVASAEANIDEFTLTMNEDQWTANANGTARFSGPGLTVPVKAGSSELDLENIGFFEDGNYTKGLGYGAAIDLGATYELMDGLTLSAALLDLGFISWGNSTYAHTSNSGWTFDGFGEISLDENSANSLSKQFEALGEDLQDMIVLYKDGETRGYTEMLSCRLNIGAEYQMPFYERLSAGLLYSGRFNGEYSNHQARLFVNCSPVDWFQISTNYGLTSYGSVWGAMINFDLPVIGLFVGADNIVLNTTPKIDGLGIGLPVNKFNLGLSFGLTFNLGRLRYL